jgi:GxxExxY protein
MRIFEAGSTNQKLLHGEEVYRIVGAAIEVASQLGRGFLEVVYQEALALELRSHRIPFEEQTALSIKYKDRQLKATYVADFVCFERIIVEIKALNALSNREEAQILNYLKASHHQVGLLINFGTTRLEWKRFILT